MSVWICTVIVNRPGKKGSRTCPLSSSVYGPGHFCTAAHGRHHSFLVEADNLEQAEEAARGTGHYLARVESTSYSSLVEHYRNLYMDMMNQRDDLLFRYEGKYPKGSDAT